MFNNIKSNINLDRIKDRIKILLEEFKELKANPAKFDELREQTGLSHGKISGPDGT